MMLRPGFAIFLGSKLSAAAREYKLSLHRYASAVCCICVDTAEEAHLERAFYNSTGLLDARSIRKLIEEQLVPDSNLGQVSAFFFVDSEQLDFLAAALKAFIAALDRISFDIRRVHFVTVVAGPADREKAKLSCFQVHEVFRSSAGDASGVQTAVLMLLPWYDGAPIQNRADVYRLVGFVGQLCSLSASDPRHTDFSQFKNAHFVGKTYIAGLRSYATGRVDAAVQSFVLAAAWKRIGLLFQGRDVPSRKQLCDLIREAFPQFIGAVELDDDLLGQLALERARKEYLPIFLSKLTGQVRTYAEFVQLIKLIAQETNDVTNQVGVCGVIALMMWTLTMPTWLFGMGICIAIVTAFAILSRWRRASKVADAQPPTAEMPGSLPTNRLLHRVFDEFSASLLPVEVVNAPRPSHRLSGLDLLPFQECYDPSESTSGQLAADNQIVTVAADVVSSLFVVTGHSDWIAASGVEALRTGLVRCQEAAAKAIYADFASWVQMKQIVASTEQHRWLFSQRMPITDIRCFEFRPEALVSDCSEASLIGDSVNFLYLVPTQWN
jgi:hypothetical protein